MCFKVFSFIKFHARFHKYVLIVCPNIVLCHAPELDDPTKV